MSLKNYEPGYQTSVEECNNYKIPLIIIIDKSASLSGYNGVIEEGLRVMKDTLLNNNISKMVEVSFVLFDAGAEIVPFTQISRLEIPQIVCDGPRSDMHAAVELALKVADARKKEYKRLGIHFFRPIFLLLTDGCSTDRDNGSFNELLKRQRNGKAAFFVFAIGDKKNLSELEMMPKDGMILSCSSNEIRETFEHLASTFAKSCIVTDLVI